jgi:hypothetical protein
MRAHNNNYSSHENATHHIDTGLSRTPAGEGRYRRTGVQSCDRAVNQHDRLDIRDQAYVDEQGDSTARYVVMVRRVRRSNTSQCQLTGSVLGMFAEHSTAKGEACD